MSDNPFDRVVINVRERPLSTDINRAQSQIERTLRFYVDQLMVPRAAAADQRAGTPVTGFIGNGFNVREDSPVGQSVIVASGLGFKNDAADVNTAIGGISGVDDLQRYKPILMLADATVNVPLNGGVDPRVDIIEVNINRRLADASNRETLNPVTGVFTSGSVQKTLAWNIDPVSDVGTVATPSNSTAALSIKTGVANVTPVAPPVSPGYVKVAEILVAAAFTQIDQNVIQDFRRLVAPFGIRRASAQATLVGAVWTVNSILAPPGVQMAFNSTGGTLRLYVVAGDLTGVAPVVASTKTATGVGVTVTIPTVDTTLQTRLANVAETFPTIEAAVGQEVMELVMSPGGDNTYNVQVEW